MQDANKIHEIKGERNLSLRNMKIVDDICDDLILPTEKYANAQQTLVITVEQEHSLLDIVLYNEYATKLSFLSSGDKISVFGPAALLLNPSRPRQIKESSRTERVFVPFMVLLHPDISHNCLVEVTSQRISNLRRCICLEKGNIKTINIPLLPVFNVHNIEGDINQGVDINESPKSKRSRQSSPIATREPRYDKYLTLSEIKESTRINTNARALYNVLVVVVGFSGVKTTQSNTKAGEKYCMIFHVIDKTFPSPQTPCPFILFSNYIEKFPLVLNVGDLLRINRVFGQIFDGKLQLRGNFREGKAISILTIHKRLDIISGMLTDQSNEMPVESTSPSRSNTMPVGLDSDTWQVVESTSKSYSYHPSESEEIKRLHEWGQKILFQESMIQDKIVTVNDLYQRRFGPYQTGYDWKSCDTIAMIVRIERATDTRGQAVTIWDGRGTAPNDANSVPASKGVCLSFHIAKLYSTCEHFEMIYQEEIQRQIQQLTLNPTAIPLPGRFVQLWTVDNTENHLLTRLREGMWVKFRNLHTNYGKPLLDSESAADNIPVALIGQDTHICPLLPYYRDIRDGMHRETVSNRVIPRQSIARSTHSSHGHPYTSLVVELLNQIFVQNRGEKDEYLFTIKVVDDTAQCDVIFVGDDAEQFLNLPVADFLDPQNQDNVLQRLKEVVNSCQKLTFYIQTYLVESRDQVERRSSGDDIQDSSVTRNQSMMVKRIRGFDTNLFEKRDVANIMAS